MQLAIYLEISHLVQQSPRQTQKMEASKTGESSVEAPTPPSAHDTNIHMLPQFTPEQKV